MNPVVILLAAIAFLLTACVDMNLVLCSALEGTLVDKDKKPLAGVQIERTWHWHWGDKKGSEKTVTDTQGRFSFPEIRRLGSCPSWFLTRR